MFLAKTWDVMKSHDPYGANTAIIKAGSNPQQLIQQIQTVMKHSGYKYVLVGGPYSNLVRSETDLSSKCSQFELGSFMLAVEPGMYLICQGWAAEFERLLGAPLGPAVVSAGMLTRQFESGTKVQWKLGSKDVTIKWG